MDDPSPEPAPAAPALDAAMLPGLRVPLDQLASAVEAILLTVDKPIPALRLAEALGLVQVQDEPPPESSGDPEPAPPPRPRRRSRSRPEAHADPLSLIDQAVEDLNKSYSSSGRSFRIESVAGGFRIMTLPAFAPAIAAFHKARASSRLSRAAIETLAIIAYKQPITRAHLEAIRGVNCGEVLRSLMERRLVCIKGRAEELGRPILYGTGKEFLDAFGLASLKDLPSASELQVTP